MEQKVRDYIEKNQMLQRKDRIVVGISGGADSVCLFFVLLFLKKEYELELFPVHVNHGIRGEEGEKDQRFVEDLGKKYETEVRSFYRDIREYAKIEGLSEEEAGRKVRYDIFYQVLKENGCNKIAVAHNMNDNGETMLFHLARGSAVKGLCGISPVRDEIIRPLLCVTRQEIENYLREKQQNFCIDRTNFTGDYTRNRIRHNVIPVLEQQINKKAVEHMGKTAELLRETQSFVDKIIKETYQTVVREEKGQYLLKAQSFQKLDKVIQKGILREMLLALGGKQKDISYVHIQSLLELTGMEVGKKVNLPYGMQGIKGYETLILKKAEPAVAKKETYEILISRSGTYKIPGTNQEIEIIIDNDTHNLDEIPKNDYTKWFDYDKIGNVVQLRTRRSGDYLQIKEAGGTKKLKDYFIDEKVPKEKRDNIPLLADGKHIIWVLGKRISEKYKLTEGTRSILKVRVIGGSGDE